MAGADDRREMEQLPLSEAALHLAAFLALGLLALFFGLWLVLPWRCRNKEGGGPPR
ncbi:MAG: hypothetical protein H6R10_1161 [Rhodocyclaceae bacterium]|nr:hypothetical protein [Rhodocyclaceae bacterium]